MNPEAVAARLLNEGWTETEIPPDLMDVQQNPEVWVPVLTALGGLLADEYLSRHSLTADRVALAEMYNSGGTYEPPPEVAEQMEEVQRRIRVGRLTAAALRGLDGLDPDADVPAELVEAEPELVQRIREQARGLVDSFTGTGWRPAMFSWAFDAGGVLREDVERWGAAMEPYRVTPEQRDQRLRELLGDAPSVRAWLADRGWAQAVTPFMVRISRLNHQESGRGRAVVTVDILRPAYPVPYPVLSMTAPERHWRERGWEGASLAPVRLSVVERDILRAVLRARGGVKEEEWGGWVEMNWATWCEATGTSPRESAKVRRNVDALYRLMDKKLFYTIEGQDGTTVGRVAILQGVELKYQGDDAKKLERGTGWMGRAPSVVRVMLSTPFRSLGRSLWFSVERDKALSAATDKIRGGRRNDLDEALRDELYRTRQAKGGISYVNREEFMESYLGADVYAGHKQGRRYTARVERPYLTAVEVLKEAGTILEWTPGHQTARGVRDRFKVAPPLGRVPE
jgi:hypothetical protein